MPSDYEKSPTDGHYYQDSPNRIERGRAGGDGPFYSDLERVANHESCGPGTSGPGNMTFLRFKNDREPAHPSYGTKNQQK